jgi:hypothetical protein
MRKALENVPWWWHTLWKIHWFFRGLATKQKFFLNANIFKSLLCWTLPSLCLANLATTKLTLFCN